jgi:hypothetical protein
MPGLDIRGMSFANRDHAIVTTLTFKRDRRGVALVGIRTRRGKLTTTIESRHRRHGLDHTFVQQGAPCKHVTARWQRRPAQVTIRLPARCLHKGDFGALRMASATTLLSNDSRAIDYAPQRRDGSVLFTDWIPRG